MHHNWEGVINVESLTPKQLVKAFTPRQHLKVIREKVKKATAAFYGDECLRPFITPYSAKEDSNKYEKRITETLNHYDNYLALVINKYVEGIFRLKQDSRTTGNSTLDAWLLTTYYKWLVNDLVPPSMYNPEVYVYLEKPKAPEGVSITTQADEEQLGLIPMPHVIFPQHVISYDVDKDGDFIWVCIRRGEGYEILTETHSLSYDKNKVLIPDESFEHGFDEVPLIKIVYTYNQYYEGKIGHAFLTDIVNKSIGSLQFISMFIEACAAHLSYKLKMSKETFDQTAHHGIGNQNIILEKGGTTNVPTGYVALPGVELDKMIDIVFNRIPKSVETAARLLLIGNTSDESGIAKLIKAVPENSALSNIVEYIWGYDEKIVLRIAKGYGPTKNAEVKVVYPMQFDVRTPSEQMQDITSLVEALSTGTIPSSPTGNGEIMKRWYHSILPDVDTKMVDIIDKEIEEFVKNGKLPSTLINELDKEFPSNNADEQTKSGNIKNGKDQESELKNTTKSFLPTKPVKPITPKSSAPAT